MLNVVKLLLKGEVGVCALNSHGNYIADHGIVFLNFCGNPDCSKILQNALEHSAIFLTCVMRYLVLKTNFLSF